jgi:hypothetical protein
MKLNRHLLTGGFLSILFICAAGGASVRAQSAGQGQGVVVTDTLRSTILRQNLVGVDANRPVHIYLPPGYANSGKSYPVVYFFHTVYTNPQRVLAEGDLPRLLDEAFEKNVVKPFIFVMADYSTATTGSFYENSAVSGRWLDFTVQELVPFIDHRFRTLANRDSRALTGNYLGGRGALKLAMEHAELFGVVYAMHPVATGTGYLPWSSFPADWKKTLSAKSPAELKGDFALGLCQAFLPNVNRPPFYCDFFMELDQGEPRLQVANTARAQADFLLDRSLAASAPKLRTLRGLAFDWARFDPNQDHVYSARAFAGKLEDLGVEYEAEEYSGTPFNKLWGENGRWFTRALPFLSRHLVFDAEK